MSKFSRVLVLLIVLGILSACLPSPVPLPAPTATPYPTYTPFPTQTPLPTYTPLPTATPLPPTAAPTPIPPTDTAVPPTATRVPPTATPLLPTRTPRPSPTSEFPEIPSGMGGLIVINYYGNELNYEIGGKLYKVPGSGGRVFIHLPPGKHNFSADIPGRGRAGGTIEILLGVYRSQSWADR